MNEWLGPDKFNCVFWVRKATCYGPETGFENGFETAKSCLGRDEITTLFLTWGDEK